MIRSECKDAPRHCVTPSSVEDGLHAEGDETGLAWRLDQLRSTWHGLARPVLLVNTAIPYRPVLGRPEGAVCCQSVHSGRHMQTGSVPALGQQD